MFACFRTARKAGLRIFVLLSFAWLAACDVPLSADANVGPQIDPDDPVQVALLVPGGSAQSTDNQLAQNFENAARLAIADLDGASIELRVYNTGGGDPTQAASVATQAVNDGAKIIIGPLYAEAANAAGVAVAQDGVNVLAFSNNSTIAGGNVFILGATFDSTANRLVNYAASQGRNRIVLVHSQDVAGQLGRNAIQNAIARSSATLVGTVDYPLSQQGVVDSIPRITAAVNNGAADSVFLTSPSASALPLLTQLLPEAGVTPDVAQFIGLTRWDIPSQTLDLPGVQGGWFALPDPGREAAFRRQYEAAYGSAPHPLAGLAFDGVAAIGALVRQGRSNALTGAALTQSAGFQGASGVFRLRPDGTNQRGLAVATVQNRQVVVISPAPSGFGGAGF